MAMEIDTPLRTGMLPNGMVNREPRNEMGHSWSAMSGPSQVDAHGRRAKTIDEERLEYFGKPRFDMRQEVDADVDDENRVLPFAYMGKNRHLEKIMFAALSEADQVWTKEICPIVQMVNLGNQVEIAQYIFNNHLVDRVPEQGTIRLVTSYKRRWTEAMQRYGLGLLMEDGFAMTPMGKMHYHQHLLQIRDALLNALRLMVIDRILSAPRQPQTYYEASLMPNPNVTMLQLLEQEADQWATLQKNQNAFLKLKTMGKAALQMNKHAAAPDTLILPHGLIDEYRWKHPEETEFATAGPSGPGLLSAPGGPIGALSSEFKTIEFPKCFVGENEPLLDPSSRSRTIGEFFQMSHRFSSNVEASKWRKELMNIRVHDNDSDQMVELEYLVYLKAAGLWNTSGDDKGKLSPLGKQFFAGCTTLDQWLEAHGLLKDFLVSCKAKGVLPAAAEGCGPLLVGVAAAAAAAVAEAKSSSGALRGRVERDLGSSATALVSHVTANLSTLSTKFPNLARVCHEVKDGSMPSFEDIAILALVDGPAVTDASSSAAASATKKRSTSGSKFLAVLDHAIAKRGNAVERLTENFQTVLTAQDVMGAADEWIASVLASKNLEDQADMALRNVSAPRASSGAFSSTGTTGGLKLESFTWQLVETLHSKDVRIPLNLLLFRPHMSYQMGSAVMMKRGAVTMQTLLGNENFQLSRDGSRKMLLGNYTVYAGIAVVAPENIYVMDNVSCQAYLGGGGVKPYDANEKMVNLYRQSNQRLPCDIFVVTIPASERVSSQVPYPLFFPKGWCSLD